MGKTMCALFDLDSSKLESESMIVDLPSKERAFSDAVSLLFDNFTNEHFSNSLEIPYGFEDFVTTVYKFHNQKIDKMSFYELRDEVTLENSNKVLIGFSGGLDSCYLACRLKSKGYEVVLFHVDNLNSYAQPNEDNYAREFAKHGGFEYIEVNFKPRKHNFFNENPIKNQLVLAFMLDYVIENNINNIGLGCDWTQTLDDSTVGLDATDSKEFNETFWKAVERVVHNVNLIFCEDEVKKVDRIAFLLENYTELFQYVYSCVLPYRFTKSSHERNESKYGVPLLKGRCGSCVKCCREFLYLVHLGWYNERDEETNKFCEHCWDILANSKYAVLPEKYKLSLPLEVRWKNLLEEGS